MLTDCTNTPNVPFILLAPPSYRYYMAPAGVVCMLVLVIIFEARPMIESDAYNIISANPASFFAASILGFGLNILSFVLLKLSSALLLKGISIARTAALVIFCSTFLGESVTVTGFLGYTISLGCFVWYNAIRMGVR